MWTDLNMDDSSTLLFVENAPVLNVSINHNFTPESIIVVLTFESGDEILLCDSSIETSSTFLCGTIFFYNIL